VDTLSHDALMKVDYYAITFSNGDDKITYTDIEFMKILYVLK